MIAPKNCVGGNGFFELLKLGFVHACFVLLVILALRADTWTDTGSDLTWCYEVYGGEAHIACDSDYNPSVLPPPEGDLVIPGSFDGVPVTGIGDFSLMNYGAVTSVTIPEGVRSIGAYAFYGCNNLKDLTMPDSVTCIEVGAFDGCCSLTNVTIPQHVLDQGLANVFPYSCTTLESVSILDGATGVPPGAFSGCTALRRVAMPSSIAHVDASVFADCPNIETDIVITDGVTEIREGEFAGRSWVLNVVIPASVTNVALNAFAGCTGIRNVTVSQRVLDIGLKKVFPDAYESIESATVLGGATSIPNNAFKYCYGIERVSIPSGVRNIGNNAFRKCGRLESVDIPIGVTNIGNHAFGGCSALSVVTIPDGMLSIRPYAFRDCVGLREVSIPSSVTSIGTGVFFGCSSLAGIVIPNGVTGIGLNAFRNCTSLASVSIPSSVTSIGSCAFSGCTGIVRLTVSQIVLDKQVRNVFPDACASIADVVVPESVASIPSNAFAGCTGIRRVAVPQPVLDAGIRNVFKDAYASITNVTMLGAISCIPTNAFYGCRSLAEITIPDGATSVGSAAFSGCSGLRSVSIPKSVISIANNAFNGCNGIKSAVLPQAAVGKGAKTLFPQSYAVVEDVRILDDVTTIRNSAFWPCSALKRVTIPNSVVSLDSSAFAGCSALGDVAIPDSVTSIGERAFFDCGGLTNVVIGAGVTAIGRDAFRNCGRIGSATLPQYVLDRGVKNVFPQSYATLANVTILDGATQIGDFAFSGCTGLVSVTIPKRVTSIGEYAFSNCSGLTNIALSDSLTSIGEYAFSNCSGLTSLTIPANVASIGSGAFSRCGGLVSFFVADGNMHYAQSSGLLLDKNMQCLLAVPSGFSSVTIPAGVTEIGRCAFYGCSELTSVSLPGSVTSIGEGAFCGCSGLTELAIPDGVTDIGGGAFSGCTGLASVSIPQNVTRIGDWAFSGCTGLTSVEFPDFVQDIGCAAFGGCCSLKGISLPEGLLAIEDSAFSGCTGLSSVTIPGSVTSIGCFAFSGCSGLTGLTLSEGLTSIDDYAFERCSGLTNVVMPESVESMGRGVFSGCVGLTSVTLPSRMACISDAMFFGCSRLNCVSIPNGVIEIGWETFYGCSGLASLTLPDGVACIGERAFASCTGLTSLTIPASVAWIGVDAFSGCTGITDLSVPQAVLDTGFDQVFSDCTSLRRVVLQDGVVNIGDYAFSCQYELESVTIPEGVTSIGTGAFQCCYSLTEIWLPESLTSIGTFAFAMSGVYCVSIPSGVTSVASDAFAGSAVAEFIVAADNPCYKSVSGLLLTKDGKALVCGVNGDVTIPNCVTRIEDVAFGGCNNLTSVTIPGSVTNVGNFAFSWCGALESISLPDSVTRIGDGAFSECYCLESVSIPGSVASIGDNAFCLCYGIRNVTIPQSVLDMGLQNVFPDSYDMIEHVTILDGATSIPAYAFAECFGLKSVEIPASVTSIGDGAFFLCTRLASVAIPSSVTRIGEGAFFGCDGLESVVIPQSVLDIGFATIFNSGELAPRSVKIVEGVVHIWDYAFAGISGLRSVTIPDSVTSIGRFAFSGCTNLERVVLGVGVESIGDEAFSYCSSLRRITIPCSIWDIGCSAFEGCTGLTSVTMEGCAWVGDYAFCGCVNLEELIMYGGAYGIGDYAFCDCKSLTAVTIGDLWSIGAYAFYGCTNLAEVALYGWIWSIGDYAFCNCPALTHVNVPRCCTITDRTFDSRAVWDEFVAKLGDLDPFSCPEGSTHTVLEHLFYSGTTNGVFAYPTSTADAAVLKVTVWGDGIGRLYVGDSIVPLVPPSPNHSGASTSTLLLSIERGVWQELCIDKPESLEVALNTDDLVIGSYDWIAFPHTDATVPCIHDFDCKVKTVSLVHGEEFPGLVATWESDSEDVDIANNPPVSADIHGRFKKNQSRSIYYTVDHPDRLNADPVKIPQTLRFCPRLDDDDDTSGDCDECYDPDGWTETENNEPQESGPEVGEDTTSEEESAEEYERIAALPSAEGVLQLHGEIGREDVLALSVPAGTPGRCCDCPDHCLRNYVALAGKPRRLSVCDAGNNDFGLSYEDTQVTVRGVYPSREPFGDAVHFVTNGVTSLSKSYTVLGVDFENITGPILSEYNAKSATFGLPVTVNTNLGSAASLCIRTDVLLENGIFRLALEDCAGEFEIWAPERTYCDFSGNDPVLVTIPAEKLVDSAERTSRHFTVRQWRQMVSRHAGDGRGLNVLLLSSVTGRCDLAFSFALNHNGKAIRSSVRQRITSVNPLLLPDYDRDGRVDSADVEAYMRNGIFRFWTNMETVRGRYAGELLALNLLDSPNSSNGTVDGEYDLLNFFPLAVDLKAFPQEWRDSFSFVLSAPNRPSSAFNYCVVPLSWDEAGRIYTNDVQLAGGDLLSGASVSGVDMHGVKFPLSTVPGFGTGKEIVVVEAKDEGASLRLAAVDSVGREFFTFKLPMLIVDVEKMYRWANLRPVCGDSSGEDSDLANPLWNPDSESDGRHFVFVHGYNVNAKAARVWANQMFKRLWVSGSHSMFTAVDWYGDSSQYNSLIYMDTVSPDYYANVMHAFATASNLVDTVASLPGTNKVMLAHSLGNMLTSSAAVDYGLEYKRYYMLNAAVPMEAYDVASFSPNMIDAAWTNVSASYRASNWSGLFETNDFRHELFWRGRFAGITNAVNCYSPSEEVLENATAHGYGESWAKQELLKGTTVWHGLNAILFFNDSVSCEGGWGINAYYAANPTYYVPISGFHASVNNLTRDALIEHPLFTPFRVESDSMHSTNLFTISDVGLKAELRARLLGDAIPATSFAAGANPILNNAVARNMDYEMYKDGTWPVRDKRWHHSDIKNVAYRFVWKLFHEIVNNKEEKDNGHQ